MNRVPNCPRTPNIKNRSTKQYYKLTRSGIKHLNEWHRSLGIDAYKPKKAKKSNVQPQAPVQPSDPGQPSENGK